ncbi:putative amidohydrolase family protein [Pseudoalteromonas luteoviolacea B = ATCC 29581]|nr:putative amidohydrolase family protein [Pseudoalteromonas luteoviolacea B = ATCC 29581]
MKKMTLSTLALVMGAGFSASALAQSIAITNATVHTAGELGVLKSASIVLNDGKIVAINPATVEADTVIDAQGQVVTPGLISSMNQLGLVEVGAVARSRDAGDDKAGIDFDPSSAFNPLSTLVPYARKGGITQDIVTPYGGDSIFAGLASVVDLTGEFDSVTATKKALVVKLGAESKGSRAMSFKTLVEKLEGQQTKLDKQKAEKKKDEKKDDKPSVEEQVLTDVLAGKLPMVAYSNRASDLIHLLKIKADFNLNLVLWGANDAVLVADKIAAAKVPVIMSAMENLPGDFDSMHAHLENAGKLEKAGVKVLLTVGGDASHNMYQMRFDAGNAVSNGMSYDGAIKSMTANVAEVFGINGGKVAVGQKADVVLWSGDPLELSSSVVKMFINGKEVSTESRHDKLRDRYMKKSDMPVAYTK